MNKLLALVFAFTSTVVHAQTQNCAAEIYQMDFNDDFISTRLFPKLADAEYKTDHALDIHMSLVALLPGRATPEVYQMLMNAAYQIENDVISYQRILQDYKDFSSKASDDSYKLSQCAMAVKGVECLPFTSNAINLMYKQLNDSVSLYEELSSKTREFDEAYRETALAYASGRTPRIPDFKDVANIISPLGVKISAGYESINSYNSLWKQYRNAAVNCLSN